MTSVEVLAPLRIETRFYPPTEERNSWLLRLRVYPDEFSMARVQPPPTTAELNLFDEILTAYQGSEADGETQLRVLASKVGTERAIWLRRTVTVVTAGGVPHADRKGLQDRDPGKFPLTQKPFGLPPEIHVWLVKLNDTMPYMSAVMQPNRAAIAGDLDLGAFETQSGVESGRLPETWWTSFRRARDLGLATEIEFPEGEPVPDLEAIVVCGLGDTRPETLIETHASSGRLAVLKPGTATNTVNGEQTAEMGGDPSSWQSIDTNPPEAGSASRLIVDTLSGFKAAPIKLHGGDAPAGGDGSLIVQALWPVLWGHSLRDMIGASEAEARVAEWAAANLSPEGPYPAIRVGQQPYGILPASVLKSWVDSDQTEQQIRNWVIGWREWAAQDAIATDGNVVGATAERAIQLLGLDSPTTKWGVRLVTTLPVANAIRLQGGYPPTSPTSWENLAAGSLAGSSSPLRPLAPCTRVFALPQSSRHGYEDDPETLMALLEVDGEVFPLRWERPMGLLGHLVFETIVLLRAKIGLAREAMLAGLPVDPDAPLPLHEGSDRIVTLAQKGLGGSLANPNLGDLESAGGGGQRLVKRHFHNMEALRALVHAHAADTEGVFACLLAALDTASHRVDPWICGIINARLLRMGEEGAPFLLGVYGWVDRPAPFDPQNPGSGLPPGPTAAGLLHAPSQTQAMMAAVLRDAAVRYPGDHRWDMAINSSKVRAATRLAERVRLGCHPYEALGLEVERIIGDWDTVRELRKNHPQRSSHDGQRCCDGARVLRLLFRRFPGDPPPPVVSAEALNELEIYDSALDTYADLLVADGVHALVSGQGGVGNASMEAAAGLGAPPDMRSVRTPRRVTTVRVSAWALLAPGVENADGPAQYADPAFANLLDAELGPANSWTWSVGDKAVSLADRILHGADVLSLKNDELDRLLRDGLDAALPFTSMGGAKKLARANRLAELLGGGDNNPPVPDPADGRDEASAQVSPLRQQMLANLSGRMDALRDRLGTLIAQIDAADLQDPNTVAWALGQFRAWHADAAEDEEPLAQGRARLQTRLVAAGKVVLSVNDLRIGIRNLVGNSRLPVLPVVNGSVLGTMRRSPADPTGRPEIDRKWLEIVAAVHPRLAQLEALQLDSARTPWPAAIGTGDDTGDPWTPDGPVIVAYGPGSELLPGPVAIAGLDAWEDSIPASQHVTSAAFGFNGPKSRPPQAVLLAVPPDPGARLTHAELAAVVLETRELARARASRSGLGARIATPSALSSLPAMFWGNWR